jgi:hypothetical protein
MFIACFVKICDSFQYNFVLFTANKMLNMKQIIVKKRILLTFVVIIHIFFVNILRGIEISIKLIVIIQFL